MWFVLAISAAMAAPSGKKAPVLIVPSAVLTDDIVVSAATSEPQVITVAIRSREVEYGAVTDGLVEVAKPIAEGSSAIDRRIAAETAHQQR